MIPGGIALLQHSTWALTIQSLVAIVGMTTATTLSTTFEGEKTPSWTQRMNIKKTLNSTLGCDPTVLVAGATYRTPNGAFTYTVQNFVDRNTRNVFSSMSYNGSSLSSCYIQMMDVLVNFVTVDALFQARINCTLDGNVEMMITAPSLVTLRTDTESSIMRRYEQDLNHPQTQSTYLAPAIAKLLAAFGLDFMNQFLPEIPASVLGPRPLNTVYSGFVISSEAKFGYYGATWSGYGVLSNGGGSLQNGFSNKSISVFENFALVFRSAVLADLGVTSGLNPLTNGTLLRQLIHQNLLVPPGISYSWINGTAADFVLSNPTDFQLPFADIHSTSFNARYNCRNMWWKTPTSLVVDVLVATMSFFTVFWAGLGTSLQYFAVKSSKHGQFDS
ncbi:hypothetical protein FRC09_020593 [Ceratobasidium sp. 395]|nr:hypothetical protein FRC09_020593 [Ceratobasidium sp. 395]